MRKVGWLKTMRGAPAARLQVLKDLKGLEPTLVDLHDLDRPSFASQSTRIHVDRLACIGEIRGCAKQGMDHEVVVIQEIFILNSEEDAYTK